MIADQRYFIHEYNDQHRERFNDDLFYRNENDIIEELKKVILSCQRDRFFTIKVLEFKVIDNYEEMINILYEYQENLYKNNKRKKRDNQFEHINLKDSDMKLLIIRYYIKAKNEEETIDVYLCIPRIVNKYYFRISGILYSAMYQIVDGSTYNNSGSTNAKRTSVITLKSFMPIRIYRNFIKLETHDCQEIECPIYNANIFSKSIPALKYIFAKYGLYAGLSFIGVNCITITDKLIDDDNYYHFIKNGGIFINVPKIVFDNDVMTQNVVSTLYRCIGTDYNRIFADDFWKESLGGDFGPNTPDNGIALLDSLESIYDISTRESIRLPIEQKRTVYDILKWMMKEFNELKLKDNLDVGYKKIRFAEYISSLYSMKLCNGLYRISRKVKDITTKSIKKVIMIPPMYLLSSISRCPLVNYRDLVNDLDSTTALKYSIKGVSGLGEKNNKSVPRDFRFVNPTQLGRYDLDSSHKSDPGMSGDLVPFVKLYNGKYFSDYEEPNFWEESFSKLMDEYKSLVGLKEIITFRKNILNMEVDKEEENILDDNINTVKQLMNPIRFVVNQNTVETIEHPLEEGGMIYHEYR